MSTLYEQSTRVYMLTGRVAHLLEPDWSPSSTAARSWCGITTWPDHWRGTGSYAEIRQAEDMPTCITCQRYINRAETIAAERKEGGRV